MQHRGDDIDLFGFGQILRCRDNCVDLITHLPEPAGPDEFEIAIAQHRSADAVNRITDWPTDQPGHHRQIVAADIGPPAGGRGKHARGAFGDKLDPPRTHEVDHSLDDHSHRQGRGDREFHCSTRSLANRVEQQMLNDAPAAALGCVDGDRSDRDRNCD